MDLESDDIQTNSIIKEYECHCRALEKYCLMDFVSTLKMIYPHHTTLEDPFEDKFDPFDLDINEPLDRDIEIL